MIKICNSEESNKSWGVLEIPSDVENGMEAKIKTIENTPGLPTNPINPPPKQSCVTQVRCPWLEIIKSQFPLSPSPNINEKETKEIEEQPGLIPW